MKPVYCVLLVSVGIVCLVAYWVANPSFESAVSFAARPEPDAEVDEHEMDVGPTFAGYPVLEGEASGRSGVDFARASESWLSPDARVIGVSFGTTHRAYSIDALSGAPDRHVINDLVDSKPITVTYCDIGKCARVLTSAHQQTALTIGVGGAVEFPHGLEMLLVVGGKKILQTSDKMPYVDVPFVEVSWQEWQALHPESEVYEGTRHIPDGWNSIPKS